MRLARGLLDHFLRCIDTAYRAARVHAGLRGERKRARSAAHIEDRLVGSQSRQLDEPLVQCAPMSERQQSRDEVVVACMRTQDESLRGGC